MSYYTALITKWGTLAPDTTANKLIAINAQTVTGSIPTTIYATGDQVFNCITWSEFNALTAQQQSNILAVCQMSGQLLGGSANTTRMLAGMIVAYFPLAGSTIANLTALSKGAVIPWWQSAGYSGPINTSDLAQAGGLT